MVAKRFNAATDLGPLRLLNRMSRQLDHHAQVIFRVLVEQTFYIGVGGVDWIGGITKGDGVTVRGGESSCSHFVVMRAAIKADWKFRLAGDAKEAVAVAL